MTLDDLRRFAVTRSLFKPTTLPRALARMGFVQADPIRAPARAQDLTLRHRVKDYKAGDLERRYESLGIEEDFFTTYGFVTRELEALMHPRPDMLVPAEGSQKIPALEREKERLLLDFVAERGAVHPREVEEHFAHGTVRNYWGGSSHATTQMLDGLHYRGLLRVARREKGIRIYRSSERRFATVEGASKAPLLEPVDAATRRERSDALVDAAVNIYAPLPGISLSYYVRRLRFAVPQWSGEVTEALRRSRERLAHALVEGIDWYWPNEDNSRKAPAPETVRLLAPFDPVVHDRTRFELFWGWVYRFEAYTPAEKRKLGYYALPLLWRDRVIGWGNLAVKQGALTYDLGYVAGHSPRGRAFKSELEAELERVATFLGVRKVMPNE
ncbi:MAG: winged helix-turn-helix domain-containing protein [Chthoniobacterales bacterium]|nr:winged helix-turn-helix domain-containing protein [Chthoniobacterales bacterium]